MRMLITYYFNRYSMGLPMTAKKLHKITNQDLIDDEVEAIDGYQDAIEESDNPEAIEVYEHIKGEEEEHIAELEGLDKMKAEDITSEQAWEDFKAGYSDFEEKHIGKDRDGDKASLSEKIDLMNAKLEELNTDVSRLTDSVPQALGVIEEGKTVEEEAEQEESDDDLFGADDDFDSLFGSDDAGEEPAVDEDGNPIEESAKDSEEITDENGEPVDGDEVTEGEEVADDDVAVDDKEISEESVEESDDAEEDMPDADGESNGEEADVTEEDYIPIEDLDEEESEDDEEEVLEKMVKVLAKLDKRVTHLERENMGLKKMLSQRQVQTQATPVAKSRPKPNTSMKMVKGSYNRPPVSTQYVANQRDIGIGKKKESDEETPVFHQALNEVFENCNRIANQTN